MKLMGFNFKKISAEKYTDKAEKINVNTNIKIDKIEKVNSDFLKTKEEIIAVHFTHTMDYEPKFAKIEFGGVAILSIEPKKAKSILNDWKEEKIDPDFRLSISNLVFKKSGVKALQLEEELNLPFHIPMPEIKKGEKK